MARCEHCNNEYDKCFTVVIGGTEHVFDSFECAIASLAPRCAHCGVKIIGHGLEAGDRYFCCNHCAEAAGIHGMSDRAGQSAT